MGFVALEARQQKGLVCQESGPVFIDCEFLLKKPKNPKCNECPCYEKQSGDVDKYLRAILDSLESIIYRNDTQVISAHGTKRWAEHGERAGARVIVTMQGEPTCPKNSKKL